MNFEEFASSLSADNPPGNLAELLVALWHDAKDDWDRAHKIVQTMESANASWVHAYLHRKEGDLDNARYWYRRAGRPESHLSLSSEWETIAVHLLNANS